MASYPVQRTVEVDGSPTTINYVDCGESAKGSATVFLVHGLGGRWQHWLRVLPAISTRWRVIAVDLPGFGRSPLPRRRITLEYLADAIAALARALELERIAFVGHSFGGPLGTTFAARHPDLAERLVIVAGTVQSFQQTLARRLRPWLTRPVTAAATAAELLYTAVPLPTWTHAFVARSPVLRSLVLWPFVWAPRRLSEEDAVLLIEGGGATGVFPTARAIAEASGWEHLPVQVPVTLINGDHDLIAPLADLRNYRGRIRDALVVKGVGHLPMIEAPGAFMSALARALEH